MDIVFTSIVQLPAKIILVVVSVKRAATALGWQGAIFFSEGNFSWIERAVSDGPGGHTYIETIELSRPGAYAYPLKINCFNILCTKRGKSKKLNYLLQAVGK